LGLLRHWWIVVKLVLTLAMIAAPAIMPEFAVEHYVLARGIRSPGSGPHNWEHDLFAGVGAAE
jgi:hypothetical protein